MGYKFERKSGKKMNTSVVRTPKIQVSHQIGRKHGDLYNPAEAITANCQQQSGSFDNIYYTS